MSKSSNEVEQVFFELPDKWEWVALGNICNPLNGRAFKSTEWRDSGVPIIRIQNLKSSEKLFNYFQGDLDDKHKVVAGDLLFAWSGTPGTSFGAHIWNGSDAALNQHIFNVQFDVSKILPKYFCYALNQNVTRYVEQAQGGVGLAHITKGKFMASKIPLAPLEQQKRIVAEIEKQFSRLDEAVANLKRVKANLKRYKAAVLKAAVEGKLTEEWRKQHPDVEPADKLLERILEERRANWLGKGKYKEPVATDTSGLPELPAGWTWATIGQLATKVTDGTHHTPTYVPKGVSFISVKDIRDGSISFDDCKYITEEEHGELIMRCDPAFGDVLITKSGTIGRTAVVNTERPFSLFVSVALVKPVRELIDQMYLRLALDYYILNIDISQDVKGGLLKNLHLEDLRLVKAPLPSLAEQHQIVAEVERRLSIVTGAETQVNANMRRADRLRQSILKQAFSGQLIPQDPNDEPASVLLERIRATQPVQTKEPAAHQHKRRTPAHKTGAPAPNPLPLVAETTATYGDAIAARILAAMQPGREYARADLADSLGLSTGQWKAAIQELKRVGKVRQTGERRGARYLLTGRALQ